ncbi:hypothetical protein ACPXCH_35195 [Streptomyces albogriseolus]|uniref:hypothetical protein n=1 Tax=Streptomyces albogriseolus TaxID=1887 RepID=UPI003CE673DB
MCIGAIIGSVVGGGAYALTHRDDFDWGDFAAATAQGAGIGAVGGFLAPAGTALATQLGLQGGRALAVATVTDAAIGVGLTWAINTVQCQPTTPTDILVGAFTGGLGNLIKPAWGALRGNLFVPSVKVHAYAPGWGVPNYGSRAAGGTGTGPADTPIRHSGPWTRGDIGRGAYGKAPKHLGHDIEIHHADQMPGAAIHELDQKVHRGPSTDLHRNKWNQGVTDEMRKQDTQLHWWYRSQEQGWGVYHPGLWFENWP